VAVRPAPQLPVVVPPAPDAAERRTTINGIRVVEYAHRGLAAGVVDVPSLDAEMTSKTTAATTIVATLQPSPAWDLLHTAAGDAPQRTWRKVTWRGITIDVPHDWVVSRVGYGSCTDYYGGSKERIPGVVERGPLTSASGCAGELFSAIPVTGGSVSIDPGAAVPVTEPTVVERHASLVLHVEVIADAPTGVDVHVSGDDQSAQVQLLIGSNPTTIARVIASLMAG
jgi:hypothetical protein